jgi:hypothetical protein
VDGFVDDGLAAVVAGLALVGAGSGFASGVFDLGDAGFVLGDFFVVFVFVVVFGCDLLEGASSWSFAAAGSGVGRTTTGSVPWTARRRRSEYIGGLRRRRSGDGELPGTSNRRAIVREGAASDWRASWPPDG